MVLTIEIGANSAKVYIAEPVLLGDVFYFDYDGHLESGQWSIGYYQ
ncbi:MAG TPA: hypothetical protein VFI29_12975 [Hanamia sp.]|nr:hypothetical protein [Hanamia sp.]